MDFIFYLLPIHFEILQTLELAGVSVVEHHVKCNGKYDGWLLTKRERTNSSGRTQLAMCTDTIKSNYADWQYEINRTFAHEAVHAAQSCKNSNGYVEPLGFRKDVEAEAFAIQDNPNEVLRILKKYCL
jgi:myo-inositol-1-phosphate synthase